MDATTTATAATEDTTTYRVTFFGGHNAISRTFIGLPEDREVEDYMIRYGAHSAKVWKAR